MKKTASLLVYVLLLAVLLAGCEWPGGWFGGGFGSGPVAEAPEEAPEPAVLDITGAWSADLDMAGFLNGILADDEEFGKYLTLDSFPVRLRADFCEDGTYALVCDPDSVRSAMDGIRDQLIGAAYSYLEDMARERGLDMTPEELMEKSGLSMDDLLADIDKFYNAESLLGGILDMSGRYLCQDGLLALSNDPEAEPDLSKAMTVNLMGDTLTFLEGDWYLQFDGLYPVVFHRGA